MTKSIRKKQKRLRKQKPSNSYRQSCGYWLKEMRRRIKLKYELSEVDYV